MTDHEMVLLRAAVEATGGYLVLERVDADTGRWSAATDSDSPNAYVRNTLAEALTALLTDLGADVPEWPSAERLRELLGRYFTDVPIRLSEIPLPEYLALRGGS